jgi:hypothetical protein
MRRTENDIRRMSILPYPGGFKINRRGKSSKGFYPRNGRLSFLKRVNNNFLVSINL